MNSIIGLLPWNLRKKLKRFLGIPDIWNTLDRIKYNGFNSSIIFDVGAYNGSWTNSCLRIFPDAKYFLFEPQIVMYNELQRFNNDENMIIENLFLGSEEDISIKFYESGTSSSALRYGDQTPIQKKSIKLDNYCKENSIDSIDILKLDVQGYELEILKGAKNCLAFTHIVLTEVSLIDVYLDCPLANDIINYLSKMKFQLFDIGDFRRRELDGHLWQCDMVFVKNNSFLISDRRKDLKHNRPLE